MCQKVYFLRQLFHGIYYHFFMLISMIFRDFYTLSLLFYNNKRFYSCFFYILSQNETVSKSTPFETKINYKEMEI
jgi:hypothetical protein